jgi:acyl-CoA thioester hydrolase
MMEKPDQRSSEAAVPGERIWPDLAGRLIELDGAKAHVLPIRVYFEDTDFSGLVYHASYVRWCERGRSDFLRLLGSEHRTLIEGAPVAGGQPKAHQEDAPVAGGQPPDAKWASEGAMKDPKAPLKAEPAAFVVRRLNLEYLRPARIDDVLEVTTRVKQLTAATLVLDQRVSRGPEVLCTAEVTVVLVTQSGRVLRLSTALRGRLAG